MTIPPELEAQILRYYHVEKWRYAARGIVESVFSPAARPWPSPLRANF
jgi:hypothetical protein